MEPQSDDTPILLSPEEARVLGCLIEKSFTTPDVYPLSFNSVITACNQKTNRSPVVDYEADCVAEAIEGLRDKQLVLRVDGAGARVQKYRHRIGERLGLSLASQALLAVLLLRGAQTLGELRIRTERMHAFPTVEAVEAELVDVAEDCEWLLWRRLPQAAGQKEARFMHLFFGGDASPADSVGQGAAVVPHAAVAAVQERNERISQLEDRVTQLEAQLGDLQYAFREFCRQFDPE